MTDIIRNVHLFLICAMFLPFLTQPAVAQEDDSDSQAIRSTIRDYIEGWYDGDVERMDRALHPDLVKRIVYADARSGRSMYNEASKTLMMEYTRAGMGKKDAASKTQISIEVLDVDGEMAIAKSVTPQFVDYMELAKWNGAWKIVNVLWKQAPQKK